MATRSVRLRLMLIALGAIVTTLALAQVALDQVFTRHIETRSADELRVRMLELVSLIEVSPLQRAIGLARQPADPRYAQPYSGLYWQVSEHLSPILRSRSLWDREIPWVSADTGRQAQRRAGPLGNPMLALSQPVTLDDGVTERSLMVTVGLDYAEIERLRRSFKADVSLVLLLIAGVLIVWAWLQTSLGIRPLRQLRLQLEQIREGRTRRLDMGLVGEIAPVVDALNGLLDRQDETARKARERAGALAHGLKTPLTIMQGEVERLESRGDTQTARLLRQQVGLMRKHVERELARARTNGALVNGTAFVGVDDLVDRLLQLVRHLPRGETLRWTHDIPPHLRLMIDPSDFGEIAGNILDNARKWARCEVRIGIEGAGRDPGLVSVVFDDDGPGIAAPDRERALQPGGRIGTLVEGSGLGLSIVNGMLADYDSKLHLSKSPLGGLRVAFAIEGWLAPETPDQEHDCDMRDEARLTAG